MSTEPESLVSSTVPEYVLEVFKQKFRPCTIKEEADEMMTTSQLFDIFDEHLGGVNPGDVSDALKQHGFTASFDAARMVFL